jgi:hypothetical protein
MVGALREVAVQGGRLIGGCHGDDQRSSGTQLLRPYSRHLPPVRVQPFGATGSARDANHSEYVGIRNGSLDRAEEILVGSTVALMVSTIWWPRSAREEFVVASGKSLKMIGELVSIQTDAYARGAESTASGVHGEHPLLCPMTT